MYTELYCEGVPLTCTLFAEGMFSWMPEYQCLYCPAHCYCFGYGNDLINVGNWHSSNYLFEAIYTFKTKRVNWSKLINQNIIYLFFSFKLPILIKFNVYKMMIFSTLIVLNLLAFSENAT